VLQCFTRPETILRQYKPYCSVWRALPIEKLMIFVGSNLAKTGQCTLKIERFYDSCRRWDDRNIIVILYALAGVFRYETYRRLKSKTLKYTTELIDNYNYIILSVNIPTDISMINYNFEILTRNLKTVKTLSCSFLLYYFIDTYSSCLAQVDC